MRKTDTRSLTRMLFHFGNHFREICSSSAPHLTLSHSAVFSFSLFLRLKLSNHLEDPAFFLFLISITLGKIAIVTVNFVVVLLINH